MCACACGVVEELGATRVVCVAIKAVAKCDSLGVLPVGVWFVRVVSESLALAFSDSMWCAY
jgi:hypothetical protein